MGEKTLDQRRAADALKKIQRLEEEGSETYGNYKSYVKALPANILMSGLGQAVATVRSRRDRKGYPQLYGHLSTWLCGDDENAPYRNHPGGLIQAIVDNDQDHYTRAQAEAMAYLEWLRKFAEAFLVGDEGRE
jgi:CRISPR-associated protein Cmr5